MNTMTSRTEKDGNATAVRGSKKVERDPNIVYKGDRVTVWATGNGREKKGTKKELHPLLAEKLIAKGLYSESEIENDVASSKATGKATTAKGKKE